MKFFWFLAVGVLPLVGLLALLALLLSQIPMVVR